MQDLSSLSPAARANCDKLPMLCYAVVPTNEPGNRVVAIERGETGYSRTSLDQASEPVEYAHRIAKHYNDRLGVTPQQQEAMLMGSLFGFHVPGADPDGPLAQRAAQRSGTAEA